MRILPIAGVLWASGYKRRNMNENETSRLSELLRANRPTASLPAGFQNQVWQRIERSEEKPVSFLETVARWLIIPRVAVGSLAVVMLLAGGLGAAEGFKSGEQAARNRYLSAVNPSHIER